MSRPVRVALDRPFSSPFLLDMWERFGFFGMAAIVVFYLAGPVTGGGVGLSGEAAVAVFGAYMALSFLSGLPGGWLADRLLGPRTAVLAGSGLIIAGQLALVILPGRFVLSALLSIACGTGLVKPATAAMVASTRRGRAHREAAYSILYISIQVSAVAAPLLIGLLAEVVRRLRGRGRRHAHRTALLHRGHAPDR